MTSLKGRSLRLPGEERVAAEVWLDKFHIGRIYSKSVFVSLVSILGDVSNMRVRQDMFSVCKTLV